MSLIDISKNYKKAIF